MAHGSSGYIMKKGLQILLAQCWSKIVCFSRTRWSKSDTNWYLQNR